MELKGAEILVHCLLKQGVDTVFGYPGGTILEVYDALFHHQKEIRHILTAHEQGAAHAADGYARSSGKVGVCMATSGPGSTNLVTGIATAYMDSMPMVIFTVNVAVSDLGKDCFQEIDIAGITMPITKHNFIVKELDQLENTVHRAFEIARFGRRGPVLVDITKDVTLQKGAYLGLAGSLERKKQKQQKSVASVKTLLRMEQMIRQARRPVILVGGGAAASMAQQQLLDFIKKTEAPVVDTLMGKGVFPGDRELYLGMLGMHGTKAANLAVAHCDLLVALGTRFSDRVTAEQETFASGASIIQVDLDAAEINKNIPVKLGICQDVGETLSQYNSLRRRNLKHPEWIQTVLGWKKKYPLTYQRECLSAPFLIETLWNLTKGDAVITTEVGQHQMFAAQYYPYQSPRTFLTSGGLGTMGFGLGAAIGAKFANPNKTVINIAGDGCFRMNLNELTTVVSNRLPIVELVFDNQALGMVRQLQTLFYEERYSHTNLDSVIHYPMLAAAFGMKFLEIKKTEEAYSILQEAISCKEPVLVHCLLQKEEMVWPMVFPGTSISKTYTEEEYLGKLI